MLPFRQRDLELYRLHFSCPFPSHLTATGLVTSLEPRTSAATPPTMLKSPGTSGPVPAFYPFLESSVSLAQLTSLPQQDARAYATICRPTSSTTRSPVPQSRPHLHEFAEKGKRPDLDIPEIYYFLTPPFLFLFCREAQGNVHMPYTHVRRWARKLRIAAKIEESSR